MNLAREQKSLATPAIKQWSQARGSGAASGPPDALVQPSNFSKIENITYFKQI
jgi:hypothetical protein